MAQLLLDSPFINELNKRVNSLKRHCSKEKIQMQTHYVSCRRDCLRIAGVHLLKATKRINNTDDHER